MMSFKDLAQQRRSHRKFTNEEIDPEDLKLILRAALMSPTSKGQRAWQFVVVDDWQYILLKGVVVFKNGELIRIKVFCIGIYDCCPKMPIFDAIKLPK